MKRAINQIRTGNLAQKMAKLTKMKVLVLGFFVVSALVLPIKGYMGLAQDNASVPLPDISKEELLKKTKTSKFFDRIKTEISLSETSLMEINSQVNDANSKIHDAQEQITTLSEQLLNLDKQIKNSEDMISNVSSQITRKQSEIDVLEYQIEQKKTEISFQKKTILEYIKVIFKDQSQFSSMSENGTELNTLKLLLSDDTTSENLRSLRYSEVLANQGKEIFEKLNTMLDEQEINQKVLEVKKRTLQLLHIKLQEEKDNLNIQKQAKANLLEQTKGDQKIYEAMLAKSSAEQQDMLMEIDTLRKNMLFVKERMKTLGDNFNPDNYTSLLNAGTDKNFVEYLAGATGSSADFQPKWPVNPARGITAFYHENAYYNYFQMTHNAIDIRSPQNTPIHAPADGVVYRTQDNGFGYSHIMIAHAGGFMTLYGHVTEILVTEGQEVSARDIIGLSGGTPGTKGSGIFTTGAHLHFEILKDGMHVDPLDYMNLAYLQLETLPEKYIAKALGDRQKVRRMPILVKVRNPNSTKPVN